MSIDGDNIERELSTYLPQLSEMGNKDDISLSGKISHLTCDSSRVLKFIQSKKVSRTIQNEHRIRKQEIETISSRLDTLRMRLNRQKNSRLTQQTELDDMRKRIREREAVIEELDKTINTSRNEIEELEKVLNEKEASFESWKFTSKNKLAEIEELMNELMDQNTICKDKLDYTNW